jgi:hypothetical protein
MTHPSIIRSFMKTRFFLAALPLGALPLEAAIIQIDLGYNTTGTAPDVVDRKTTTTGWNNSYWSASTPTPVANLVDSTGSLTGYSFSVTTNGLTGPAETGNLLAGVPATAYSDSVYGGENLTVFTISNLNPTLTYNFKFYSAVNRGDGVNRNSRFTIGSSFTEIQSRNNSSWTDTLSGISPDEFGKINITVSRGSGNTSSSYLLNIIHMESVPEPSAALLCYLGVIPLLRRRR